MVRCGRCGAEVSAWAARCPECWEELDGAAPVVVMAGGRRRRWGLIAGGCAVVLVAVVVGGIAVGRRGGRRVSPLAIYTLVDAGADRNVTVVPLGAGRRIVEPQHATGYPDRPVRTAHGVVFVAGGIAYNLGYPFLGPPRPLGPAEQVLAEGDSPTVSVVRQVSGSATVASVPVDPGFVAGTETFTLPAGYEPVARVSRGFLLQADDGQLRVWNGTLVATLGRARSVVDVNGDEVAWVDTASQLHITDTASGRDAVQAPPAGHSGFIGGGAFSPNGAFLAAFVDGPGSSAGPQAQLVVIGPKADPAPVATVRVGEPVGSAVWTPDGSWVLFCGLDGMRAYEPGRAGVVDVGQPGSYSFTVF